MNNTTLKLCALLAIYTPLATGFASEAQAPDEYDIKAAFIYNFARFVTWPGESENADQAEQAQDSTFEICVLGEDPFGPVLDDLGRKGLRGRAIRVRRLGNAQNVALCNVLFVARSEHDRFDEILAAARRWPILTVGDAGGFSEAGGLITFVIRKLLIGAGRQIVSCVDRPGRKNEAPAQDDPVRTPRGA